MKPTLTEMLKETFADENETIGYLLAQYQKLLTRSARSLTARPCCTGLL